MCHFPVPNKPEVVLSKFGFTGSPQVTGLGPGNRAYKPWIMTPGVDAAQVEGWWLRPGEPQSGVVVVTGVPSALSGQNLLGDCGSSVCLGQFCGTSRQLLSKDRGYSV